MSSSAALFRAVDGDRLPKIRECLEAGIDPNIRNREGQTPLIRAAQMVLLEVSRLLLDAAADPNLGILRKPPPSSQGWDRQAGLTPLMAIVQTGLGSAERKRQLMELLIERGARLDARTMRGESVLSMATGDLQRGWFDYFFERGALKDADEAVVLSRKLSYYRAETRDPSRLETIDHMLACIHQVGVPTAEQLRFDECVRAIQSDTPERALELLKQGLNLADVYEGQTLLMLGSRAGQSSFVKALLNEGADPNQLPKGGFETALSTAAQSGHLKIVAMLLEAGAQTDVKGASSALESARRANLTCPNPELVELIESHTKSAKTLARSRGVRSFDLNETLLLFRVESVEAVANALAAQLGGTPVIQPPFRITCESYLVFRLAGHSWTTVTQVSGVLAGKQALHPESAIALGRLLGARTLFYSRSDTADSFQYQVTDETGNNIRSMVAQNGRISHLEPAERVTNIRLKVRKVLTEEGAYAPGVGFHYSEGEEFDPGRVWSRSELAGAALVTLTVSSRALGQCDLSGISSRLPMG